MRIIPLNCKSCGKSLQIKEGMDQLACAYCGAQMYVEREGGAVSLQLVEALGSIRTGAVQTAAELALVRLSGEHDQCSRGIQTLENAAQRCESNFNPGQLLSKGALDSAETHAAALRTRAATLRTEIEERINAQVHVWGVGAITSILGGMVGCNVASGFNSFLAFVGVPIIGFILTASIAAFSGPGSRAEELEKRTVELAKLEGEIHAHQTALEHETKLSEIRPQLVEARAELARLQNEINHNKNIVTLR